MVEVRLLEREIGGGGLQAGLSGRGVGFSGEGRLSRRGWELYQGEVAN